MNKQDIIDDIAENLGYVHSIINTIKRCEQVHSSEVSIESELNVFAIYCDAYIERCFDKLAELS